MTNSSALLISVQMFNLATSSKLNQADLNFLHSVHAHDFMTFSNIFFLKCCFSAIFVSFLSEIFNYHRRCKISTLLIKLYKWLRGSVIIKLGNFRRDILRITINRLLGTQTDFVRHELRGKYSSERNNYANKSQSTDIRRLYSSKRHL